MPVYLVGHLQPAIHPKESWLRWVLEVPLFPQLFRLFGDALRLFGLYFGCYCEERELHASMKFLLQHLSMLCTAHSNPCWNWGPSVAHTLQTDRSEPFLERQMKWLDKRKANRGKVIPWDLTAGKWQSVKKIKAPLLPGKYCPHQITHSSTLNFLCLSVFASETSLCLSAAGMSTLQSKVRFDKIK